MHLLEIAFKTKALRNLCEKESAAIGHFPEAVGNFHSRISEMLAAEALADLLPFGLRRSPVDHRTFELDFGLGYKVVFRANHPAHEYGESIDMTLIRRVQILNVETPSESHDE